MHTRDELLSNLWLTLRSKFKNVESDPTRTTLDLWKPYCKHLIFNNAGWWRKFISCIYLFALSLDHTQTVHQNPHTAYSLLRRHCFTLHPKSIGLSRRIPRPSITTVEKIMTYNLQVGLSAWSYWRTFGLLFLFSSIVVESFVSSCVM